MTTALVTGASRSRPRALVTGASAGLGRGYARALAADGFDLVLVARSAERLRQVAGEAESEFGIRAEVVPADLSNPEDIGRLVDLIGTRRIDVLINNAGYGLLEGLLDSDPADVAALDTVLQATVRDLSWPRGRDARTRTRRHHHRLLPCRADDDGPVRRVEGVESRLHRGARRGAA